MSFLLHMSRFSTSHTGRIIYYRKNLYDLCCLQSFPNIAFLFGIKFLGVQCRPASVRDCDSSKLWEESQFAATSKEPRTWTTADRSLSFYYRLCLDLIRHSAPKLNNRRLLTVKFLSRKRQPAWTFRLSKGKVPWVMTAIYQPVFVMQDQFSLWNYCVDNRQRSDLATQVKQRIYSLWEGWNWKVVLFSKFINQV
jgi:hypothetical protein